MYFIYIYVYFLAHVIRKYKEMENENIYIFEVYILHSCICLYIAANELHCAYIKMVYVRDLMSVSFQHLTLFYVLHIIIIIIVCFILFYVYFSLFSVYIFVNFFFLFCFCDFIEIILFSVWCDTQINKKKRIYTRRNSYIQKPHKI